MSDIEQLSKLDNLILEEKRTIAREYFCDVWESAICEGIDAEIIADELISGVLKELCRNSGEGAVSKFVSKLGEREALGSFVPDRILQ